VGDLITAQEVARILDCSPDDILEWHKRGEIKGYVYKNVSGDFGERMWRGSTERTAVPSTGSIEAAEAVTITRPAEG